MQGVEAVVPVAVPSFDQMEEEVRSRTLDRLRRELRWLGTIKEEVVGLQKRIEEEKVR